MFMSLQHKAPDRNHQQLPGPDPFLLLVKLPIDRSLASLKHLDHIQAGAPQLCLV